MYIGVLTVHLINEGAIFRHGSLQAAAEGAAGHVDVFRC
jgi:hypothetical protein